MKHRRAPILRHATDFALYQPAMADQPDYAVRAIQADEQAERALSPGLADRWRAVAKSYRTLARQHTEMKYRRQPMRMPKIEDRYT